MLFEQVVAGKIHPDVPDTGQLVGKEAELKQHFDKVSWIFFWRGGK